MKLLILTLMYLFFFSFSFISIPLISCQSPTRYTPLDDIAVSCGDSGRSQAQDGRYWDGDTDNFNLSLIENPNAPKSVTIARKPRGSETVPYSTVRVSWSEFTYVFTVSSSGPKFIRLHFQPSSNQFFQPSKAFFSVKANDQFTLLSNFSAFLTASSLGRQFVEKEFCINVGEEQREINITFTPSNTPSDAYAFINGIEIVSMPFDLYYGSDQPNGFTFIGNPNLYQFENNTALEMVHRLNVGGRFISPEKDIGMYRTWKDDVGYFNIIGALSENQSMTLSFTKIPNYTAPDEVYQTARSTGNDKAKNEGYNLTWSLPVDSGFTYIVRLHFCEFQVEITQPGDREFRIYMANQTAEAYADVIVWSGGNGVPVYRDYAVIVNDQGRGKKQNLSLALHPSSTTRTRYSDAILNGIEVFKLSDSTASLAGPNPDPPPSPLSTPHTMNKPVDGTTWIWIVIAVAISLLMLILGTFCYLRMRKRRLEAEEKKRRKQYLRELTTSDNFNNANEGEDDGTEGHDLKIFSFASIVEATNNFSIENKLGQGGFGPVYKGKLRDEREIAVKRLSRTSGQGLVEFRNELILISKLQHTNLVRVLGCCIHGEEKILIYEYLPNKSLDTYIFDPIKRELLDWTKRLNIIEGIGQGLLYLHKYSRMRVIHRDLKASNVLLDENMNTKISDFGMARIFKQNETEAITMRPAGTYGYMSPEYAMEGTFSVKSDVFSFGVLMLEIVSGRRNTSFYDFDNRPLNLIGYAWELWKEGTALELKDPTLGNSCVTNQLLRIIHVGLLCVQESAAHRPTMLDVISMLSNEAMVLAAPKQPAFFTGRNVPDTSSYASKSKDCSINDLTISIMEAR